MSSVKQVNGLDEFCAHHEFCEYQDTTCKRWHPRGICFFSMCKAKPEGSGSCRHGKDCNLIHPKSIGPNMWQLPPKGKKFYFEDPRFGTKQYEEETAMPEKPQDKKITKAASKAAKKERMLKDWADTNDQADVQDAHTEIINRSTIVDMSTKISYAQVLTGNITQDEATSEAKADDKAEVNDKAEAKVNDKVDVKTKAEVIKPKVTVMLDYSGQLQKLSQNALMEGFDETQLTQLLNLLDSEYVKATNHIELLKKQTGTLKRVQAAHKIFAQK